MPDEAVEGLPRLRGLGRDPLPPPLPVRHRLHPERLLLRQEDLLPQGEVLQAVHEAPQRSLQERRGGQGCPVSENMEGAHNPTILVESY